MATKQALGEISRRIFGQLPQNNLRSGNKILNKRLKGPTVASWFHKPFAMTVGKGNPYNMQIREERQAKLDKLKRRGKGPPKKGAGKRASKKK